MPTKVAIINNQDTFSNSFIRFFDKHEIEYSVFEFRELNDSVSTEIDMKYDKIILTGTDISPFIQPGLFKEEINLICKCKIPVLGICGGHQILCLAYQGKLGETIRPIYGRTPMKIIQKSRLFSELDKQIEVFSKHRFCVKSLPPSFICIAREASSNYLYAVKHKTLPKYGVQFHPEKGSLGAIVLNNFLNLRSFN